MPYLARLALCLLFVLSSSACGGSDAQGAAPDIDFSAFDDAIDAFVADNALEGATVAIVHRDYGLVHLRAYGAFDVDRVTLLASSSKMVSVGVLMRLADRGLVDLDAPISTYLADWGDYKSDVTLAQLMSNSSGFVGLIEDPVYAPYVCQYLAVGSLDQCAAAIYEADDVADRVPPDTAFRYGGGQWQLAGGIAEHVSGKTWSELVAETYTERCGLDVFGYANYFVEALSLEGDIYDSLVYPDFFMGDVATLSPTDNPNVEGGGYTTARDYAQLLLMHLRGGVCGKHRVLSEASVARMQEDRIATYGGSTGDGPLEGYGLGWWISREQPGLVADPGAFGASPWLDTVRGYGVIVMLEADAGLGTAVREITRPILDQIFDALPSD